MVIGAAVTLDVHGDPRARRTVGVTAEQLRLILVRTCLHAAGEATGHAPPPQSLEGKV